MYIFETPNITMRIKYEDEFKAYYLYINNELYDTSDYVEDLFSCVDNRSTGCLDWDFSLDEEQPVWVEQAE